MRKINQLIKNWKRGTASSENDRVESSHNKKNKAETAMDFSSSESLWVEPLWDYSKRVYARKGIEKIVLGLQDEYHANVDIILWCCWLEKEGIDLSEEALDDVLITIDTVNQLTLIKLREVRGHLKTAFTQKQASIIAKQILNAEMMLEKVLLYRLQELTRRFADVMKDPVKPLNLRYYLEFLSIPDAQYIAESVTGTCVRAGSKSFA